jgi:hypothetical protein
MSYRRCHDATIRSLFAASKAVSSALFAIVVLFVVGKSAV